MTQVNPSYEILGINPMVENFLYQVSDGNIGKFTLLQKSGFEAMLTYLRHKMSLSLLLSNLQE